MTGGRDRSNRAPQRAEDIAEILGVRRAQAAVPDALMRRLRQILLRARKRPDQPIQDKLGRLHKNIKGKPDYWLAHGLLDLLWSVPAGSAVERSVIFWIQHGYRACHDRSPRRRKLRRVLEDAQWSAFPQVRRAAILVREMSRVSSAEIRALERFERGYPEIRISVAERVLRHQQLEHLDAVLQYLARVDGLVGGTELERERAPGLFRKLRDLPATEKVLLKLYQEYLRHYEQHGTRGRFLSALSSFGGALVPSLKVLYRDMPEGREATLRLLQQMVNFGERAAFDAMVSILEGCDETETSSVMRALVAGVTDHAIRTRNGWQSSVQDGVQALLERASSGSEIPESLQRLAARLSHVTWGEAFTYELAERVASGRATQSEQHRLRHGSMRAFAALAEIAVDVGRETEHRTAALFHIGKIFGRNHRRRARELFWSLYGEGDTEEIRIAGLKGLVRMGERPNEAQRSTLFKDYRSGSQRLRAAIVDVWDELFPDALPSARDPDLEG